jgi:hypothetical protein
MNNHQWVHNNVKLVKVKSSRKILLKNWMNHVVHAILLNALDIPATVRPWKYCVTTAVQLNDAGYNENIIISKVIKNISLITDFNCLSFIFKCFGLKVDLLLSLHLFATLAGICLPQNLSLYNAMFLLGNI